MLRLIIGNKAYSSWSLRGWLAVRQSGLAFEETVVPLYDAEWDRLRLTADFAPSGGKVPILWAGDTVVWDSLAILEYLAERAPAGRFWPEDAAARAAARSLAAEMHSGCAALRAGHSMNLRRRFPPGDLSEAVRADVARIVELWAEARSRWGGTGAFLFGDFGAADIMFAPVVTRFQTWAIPVPRFAEAYGEAVMAHPFMAEWTAAAAEEPWVIDRFEGPAA